MKEALSIPPLSKWLYNYLDVLLEPNEYGCRFWPTGINKTRYVQVSIDNTVYNLHRLICNEFSQPVLPGQVVDHICHNLAFARGECLGGIHCLHRRCLEPTHLEPKTLGQNTASGSLGYANRIMCRANLHNIQDSTAWLVKKNGERQCLGCYQIAIKRSNDRRKAKTLAERTAQ